MKHIPLVDIRTGTLSDVLTQYKDSAHSLIDASRRTFGSASQVASYALLPLADTIARKWLAKTHNPYLKEIENFSTILGRTGVYGLNLSYEFGCTTGIFRTPQGMKLLRVLDWPFPDLGKHILLVHQKGQAGEFYNATWAGLSGIFTASSTGRFSAALNLAPMRRHATGIVLDWVRNRVAMYRSNAIPPAHLLRQVFETAPDYTTAKKMLAETPLCVPALFVLCGVEQEEGCVIERLENDCVLHEIADKDRVVVANHFQSGFNGIGKGWMPREIDSKGRGDAMCGLDNHIAAQDNFDWFIPPVSNSYSRLVMSANPASGRVLLQGFEGAEAVTELLKV